MFNKFSAIKMFWGLILTAIILLLIFSSGCQKEIKGKFTQEEMASIPLAVRDNLPEPTGGLVLSVNTETITAEEVIMPAADILGPVARKNDFMNFRRYAKPVVQRYVMSKVTDVLLYQQARKKSPDNVEEMLDKAVETEVNQFVASFGGNYAEAQETIREMGYDWHQFREYQKKLILTQSYVAQEIKKDVPVTYDELKAYYEQVKDVRFTKDPYVEFSLIDIRPDMLNPKQVGQGQSSSEAAAELARELVSRLQAGEDFAGLAREYSHGHRADMGGKWPRATAGSMKEPYDKVVDKAIDMQLGEVAGPIESEEHFFIVKLDGKQTASVEKFENVQAELEAELKFKRNREKFERVVDDLIEKANISDLNGFVEFCVRDAYRQFSI